VWIFAPRPVDLEALVSLADAFAAAFDQEAASTLVATIGGRSLAVRPLVDAEGRRGAVAMLGGGTNERGRLRRALDRASARLARA
jgi:hypothetical protein